MHKLLIQYPSRFCVLDCTINNIFGHQLDPQHTLGRCLSITTCNRRQIENFSYSFVVQDGSLKERRYRCSDGVHKNGLCQTTITDGKYDMNGIETIDMTRMTQIMPPPAATPACGASLVLSSIPASIPSDPTTGKTPVGSATLRFVIHPMPAAGSLKLGRFSAMLLTPRNALISTGICRICTSPARGLTLCSTNSVRSFPACRDAPWVSPFFFKRCISSLSGLTRC